MCDARRISAHVSDEPYRTLTTELKSLVELLRDAHRPLCRKSEFTGCFLLQTTRDKGRHRTLFPLLFRHLFDDIGLRLCIGGELLSPRFIDEKAVVVNLPFFFSNAMQLGLKRMLLFLRRERGGERPIFLRFERLNFCLALADEAHSDGLHPASTQPRFDASPQNWANLVSDEPV